MANKKVLIIEDCNLIRLEVKRILEKYGLEVLELNKAEPLFEAPWRFQDIDLLLLDIILPGMDGLAALEKLRAEEAWACLPIIILSGRSDMGSVRRAIQAGAINFIRKPFSRDELLLRVEQAIGSPVLSEDSNKTELEVLANKEINRAKRGNTSVSFVEIGFSNEKQLANLQEYVLWRKAGEILRDIDSVLINNRQNLFLILPLTGFDGAKVAVEKIRQLFIELGNKDMKHSIATFPTDGETAEILLQSLDRNYCM
jgi:DNA-binding response OmpR family regulator